MSPDEADARARRYLLLTRGKDDCDIDSRFTTEIRDAYFFAWNTRAFLEGDVSQALLGNGCFAVEKATGRVLQFSSALEMQACIRQWEAGYKFSRYEICVTEVSDLVLTVRALLALDMAYVIPELAHGREWRIPERYADRDLYEFARKPPFSFFRQALWHRTSALSRLSKGSFCRASFRGDLSEGDPGPVPPRQDPARSSSAGHRP